MENSSMNFDENINLYTVIEVLTSKDISRKDKAEFIRKNKVQIRKIMDIKISGKDFKWIMKNRPLPKFRPLKNSLTKRGDKILLAKMLEIEPPEVDDYVQKTVDSLFEISDEGYLPKDKIDAIKSYVYRHGSTDNLVKFLDYELKNAKNMLSTLYSTLEYHTNGIADYFIRPIHRMSNVTMVSVYNVIDDNVKTLRDNGLLSEPQYNEIARWALVKIYQIQNNSKLINAFKTYRVLK